MKINRWYIDKFNRALAYKRNELYIFEIPVEEVTDKNKRKHIIYINKNDYLDKKEFSYLYNQIIFARKNAITNCNF